MKALKLLELRSNDYAFLESFPEKMEKLNGFTIESLTLKDGRKVRFANSRNPITVFMIQYPCPPLISLVQNRSLRD
jgi:predicted secreted protein